MAPVYAAAPGPDPAGGGASANATFLWQAMLVGGVLLNLLVGTLTVLAHISTIRARGEIQKREVTIGGAYMSREAGEARISAIERTIAGFQDALTSMRDENRDERKLDKETEEKRIQRVHERLDAVDKKVADLPSQIVALLLNTLRLHAPNLGRNDHHEH